MDQFLTGSDPVSVIGLTIAITQILKQAICGTNPVLTDRFGRLIALVVALTLCTLYVLYGGSWLYQQIVGALVDALIAMGLYQGAKLAPALYASLPRGKQADGAG